MSQDETNVSGNSDAIRDKRIANLKPFQPGQSGNPAGRPKSKPISDRLRAALEAGDADVIASKLLEGAKQGEISFIKEILDRIEGKPIATTEVTGANGGPIDAKIEIVLVRPDANGVS